MLTMSASDVDTGTARGVWKSQAEIARIKGTSRQNIANKVARLEKHGLVAVRRKGREKFVNLAQYDKALGETGDPVKELAAETARANAPDGDSRYRDAKGERETYLAEMARLDLLERQGRLRPVDEIADALSTIGREVLQSVESHASGRAEELFSLAQKGDLAAFRNRLQKSMRDWAAATATRLAAAAEESDG